MAKNFRPTGQDRFNFLTGLIAYLAHNKNSHISKVAKHFEVSEDYIREAISTINVTATQFSQYEEEQYYYFIDIDVLEETGIVEIVLQSGFEDVPRLSGRQASAIAAGLTYLATLPDFSNQKEISELLELLNQGTAVNSVRVIDYKPGTVDSSAALIRQAMLNGHRISCTYMNQRGEKSEREIDPLRLDPRGELWYLRGYCLKNGELRNFRLDHMSNVTELSVAICAEAKSIGDIVDEEYTASETDIKVTVEVDPEAYSLIGDFAADSVEIDSKTGRARAVIKVGYLPSLGRVINHYGGAARVIEPQSAREVVRNYALAALGKPTEDQLGED